MSVIIKDTCITCDACLQNCPVEAIVDDSPLLNTEFTYVKPEKCVECVDAAVPKCADLCPSEGFIVWDMPYIKE